MFFRKSVVLDLKWSQAMGFWGHPLFTNSCDSKLRSQARSFSRVARWSVGDGSKSISPKECGENKAINWPPVRKSSPSKKPCKNGQQKPNSESFLVIYGRAMLKRHIQPIFHATELTGIPRSHRPSAPVPGSRSGKPPVFLPGPDQLGRGLRLRRCRKTMGKPWENHRKTIGKWWFDRILNGIYPLVSSNMAGKSLRNGGWNS